MSCPELPRLADSAHSHLDRHAASLQSLRLLAYPCRPSTPTTGVDSEGGGLAKGLQGLVFTEVANVQWYCRTIPRYFGTGYLGRIQPTSVPQATPAVDPSPKACTQPHVTQVLSGIPVPPLPWPPVGAHVPSYTHPCNACGLSLARPGALLQSARSSSTRAGSVGWPPGLYRKSPPIQALAVGAQLLLQCQTSPTAAPCILHARLCSTGELTARFPQTLTLFTHPSQGAAASIHEESTYTRLSHEL